MAELTPAMWAGNLYRAARTEMLAATDWVEFAPSLPAETKAAYTTARQLLRDISPEMESAMATLGYECVTREWVREQVRIKLTALGLQEIKEFQ